MTKYIRKHIRWMAALGCLLAGPAWADGLAQLRQFLGGTQSVSAAFQQTVQGKQRKQVSGGLFELQRPGRFRWEYRSPYPQLIVSDAQKVWVYDPDLDQVTERQLDKALGDTPAALLAGSNELEKGFSLKAAPAKDGAEWVVATPKSTETTFQRIELGLKDNLLQRMMLLDQFGQTTVIEFTNVVRNPKLDAGRFRFTPPAGADVIRE